MDALAAHGLRPAWFDAHMGLVSREAWHRVCERHERPFILPFVPRFLWLRSFLVLSPQPADEKRRVLLGYLEALPPGLHLIQSHPAVASAELRALAAPGSPAEPWAEAYRVSDLALWLNEYYRGKGVDVLPGELVGAVERSNGGFRVALQGGRILDADVVVAGLGIVPRDELAAAAGLPTDDGISVDDRGRVAGHDDVFAAGDVARFPARDLGRYLRVEHEDHAKSHGLQVGRNMAGADEPYDHLPFFYSDLFELGYEAVGDVDSRLDTVAEWAEPNRKGVVAYVDDAGKARGFLLWDVWGKVDASRELISAGTAVDADDLRALLA